MRKSIHTAQYRTFLRVLRRRREQAGVTQVELAKRLATTQSQVSKCERGERRLDVVELWGWCEAMGVSFTGFVRELEKELGSKRFRLGKRNR